jgi:DNA-binding response OmpR family regulator
VTVCIFVIDDDPDLTETLVAWLESEGYEAYGYTDPQRALQALRVSSPDLLILDVLMPRVDGLTLTSLIRRDSDLPIILLSGKSEPSDRVIGLRLGADDYIAKPFDVDELVARVGTVLRRSAARNPITMGNMGLPAHARPDGNGNGDAEVIRFGNLVIDFRSQDIWLNSKRLTLTPSEFRLLSCLARNAGRTVSREALWEELWGRSKSMSRTLDMHVWRLREKMLAAAAESPVIETVRGFGYRLHLAAEALTEVSPP